MCMDWNMTKKSGSALENHGRTHSVSRRVDGLVGWLIDGLVRWLIGWLIDWLIDGLVG